MSEIWGPDPSMKLPACPVCGGKLEVVYSRYRQIVAVCAECRSSLTIPASAQEALRIKREEKD